MGSYDSAIMVGFICRLCSELNTNAIHIYSDKGIDMRLAEKINLMPISVEPHDSLPKTICRSCVTQLDNQYNLIQQLKRSREMILAEHARRQNEINSRSAVLCNVEQNSSSTSESCDENP